MGNKTEAQQVFDTVLTLGYMEQVELTFPLETAADSFRSALYRERKNWSKSTGSKDQIQIERDYSGFPFILTLTKVPGTMGVIIKKADGSTQEITFNKKVEVPDFIPAPVVEKFELDRQKDLMRADGIGEEEIEDYFREDTE